MSSSFPPESTSPGFLGPEPAPTTARELFGEHFAAAELYASLLCNEGSEWGLIGPRETSRIWSRHVAHCAVLAPSLPRDCSVVDIGSGAGLPGLPLAIVRPDLQVTLLEPLARRVRFLEFALEKLAAVGVNNVSIQQSKAETSGSKQLWDIATSRAVAKLDVLSGWSAPLLKVGGEIRAIRGASAPEEVVEHAAALARLELSPATVETLTFGDLETLTIVRTILVSRETSAPGRSKKSAGHRE